MGDIAFTCPACGQNLTRTGLEAGKLSICPGCKKLVEVPPQEMPDIRTFPEIARKEMPDLLALSGNEKDEALNLPALMVDTAPAPAGEIRPRKEPGFQPKIEPPPAAPPEEGVRKQPCPFCGEEILVSAIKCKYCGEFREDFEKQQKKKRRQIWAKAFVAGLVLVAIFFAVGYAGILKIRQAQRKKDGVLDAGRPAGIPAQTKPAAPPPPVPAAASGRPPAPPRKTPEQVKQDEVRDVAQAILISWRDGTQAYLNHVTGAFDDNLIFPSEWKFKSVRITGEDYATAVYFVKSSLRGERSIQTDWEFRFKREKEQWKLWKLVAQ